MTDLVKRLRDGWETCGTAVCRVKDAKSGCLCAMAADRIEALEKALETYAEDCDMTCCETIHRQGNGCGYTARAALGEKKDG